MCIKKDLIKIWHGSSYLRVSNSNIENTFTPALPEANDAFVPTVFIVMSGFWIMRLIRCFLLLNVNFTKVPAILAAITVHLVSDFLVSLARCSTANNRFVDYMARLKGAATQITKLIRHNIVSDVHKAPHFA
jgi:hypothetical protein